MCSVTKPTRIVANDEEGFGLLSLTTVHRTPSLLATVHFSSLVGLDNMSAHDWDFLLWQRASDLLQQAERIQRNFLQIAAGAHYRASHGRISCWEPPVNVVETDESLWVISALPGVATDQVEVRLEGRELVIAGERPLPRCCDDGELKIWEIPLGRFERRLRLVPSEQALSVGEISFRDGLLIIELRKHA